MLNGGLETLDCLALPPGSFLMDPKAMRYDRLRKVIPLAASEVEAVVSEEERRMGRRLYRRLFATLTYKACTKGNRRDIAECVRHMRQWAKRLGVRIPYAWVGELQKRGALHYHLLIWLPRRLLLPKFDRRGWWTHGMTKVETARNPVGYLVKYASKGSKDDRNRMRKGMRLYGYGGLPPCARESLRAKLRQRWMRNILFDRYDRPWFEELEREAVMQELEMAELERRRPRWWARRWWEEHCSERAEYEAEQKELEEDARYNRLTEAQRQAEWLAQHEFNRVWAEKKMAGEPLHRKVSGGYASTITGEFFETPWAAKFVGGVVMCWPKEARA